MLWGGMYNPILPARDRSPLPEYLMDAFQLDVLLPAIEKEAELVHYVERFSHLALLSGDYALLKSFAGQGIAPRYLDVVNLFLLLWNSDFKLRAEDFTSKYTLVRWNENDPLGQLYSMLFGHYPTIEGRSHNYEQALLKGCRASTLDIVPGAELASELCETRICPTKATAQRLAGRHAIHVGGGGTAHHGLYIGEPGNFDDLLNFWNLRAAGLSIEFVPLGHVEQFKSYIRAHLDALESKSRQLHSFFRKIGVYQRHGNDHATSHALEVLGAEKEVLYYGFDDALWNGMNLIPITFSFDARQALGNVEMTESGYRISLGLPEKTFVASDHAFADSQEVLAFIGSHYETAYPGHTLKPPFVSRLNRAYGMLAHGLPWVVRAKREGIGLLLDTVLDTTSITALAHTDILISLLEAAGLQAKPSQAGLLARRIIDKLGGIDDATIFRIPGVRKLLSETRTDQTVTRGHATEQVWSEGEFKRYENTVLGTKRKITTNDAFDFLLQKEFLRAGLELTCTHCNLPSWVPLGRIDESWVCEYCGNKHMTSLQLGDRGDWKFRRSGLFGKDNNQEGAVPVILSLLRFAGARIPTWFQQPLLVTSMHVQAGGQSMEFDFFVVNYVHDSRVELGVGEAKSAGSKIEQEDIDHFLAVKPKVEALGVDCVPIFATTAESFGESELQLFKQLVRPGVSPLLLTVSDLEDEQDFLSDPELPWRNEVFLNLKHKADNSRHKYLGLDFDGNSLPARKTQS